MQATTSQQPKRSQTQQMSIQEVIIARLVKDVPFEWCFYSKYTF